VAWHRQSGGKNRGDAAAMAYRRWTRRGCGRDAKLASFYSRALRRSNTGLHEEGEREVIVRRGGTRAGGEGTARRDTDVEHARMAQTTVRVPTAAASREGYTEWSLSIRRCLGCAGQGVARNMTTRQASVRQHTVPTRREARQLEG
jgi:hypothetical protein